MKIFGITFVLYFLKDGQGYCNVDVSNEISESFLDLEPSFTDVLY